MWSGETSASVPWGPPSPPFHWTSCRTTGEVSPGAPDEGRLPRHERLLVTPGSSLKSSPKKYGRRSVRVEGCFRISIHFPLWGRGAGGRSDLKVRCPRIEDESIVLQTISGKMFSLPPRLPWCLKCDTFLVLHVHGGGWRGARSQRGRLFS